MNFVKKIPIKVLNFLFPSKIYGAENIPSGGAVIVCNHFTAFDFLFAMKACREDIYILGKKELFKNRILAKAFKSYNVIPVDRSNVDVNTLLSVLRLLKQGKKLLIFPEGTRNKTGSNKLQPIKGGASIFAVKAKCKIVPMMSLNKLKLFRKTKVMIGNPFEVNEFYNKKLDENSIEEINRIITLKMNEQQIALKNLLNKD